MNSEIYKQDAILGTAGLFAEVFAEDNSVYNTYSTEQQKLVDALKKYHIDSFGEMEEALKKNYKHIGDKAAEVFGQTNENSHTVAADVIKQWDTNEGQESVRGAFEHAFDEITGYTKDYEQELEHLEQVSGQNITDPGGVVDDFDKIGNKVDEVDLKTKTMADNMTGYLEPLRDAVSNVADQFERMVSDINEAINSINAYLRKKEELARAQQDDDEDYDAEPGDPDEIEEASPKSSNPTGGNSASGLGGTGGFSGVSSSSSKKYTTEARSDKSGAYYVIVDSNGKLANNTKYRTKAAATAAITTGNTSSPKTTTLQKYSGLSSYLYEKDETLYQASQKKASTITTGGTKIATGIDAVSKAAPKASTATTKTTTSAYLVSYKNMSSPASSLKVAKTQAESILNTHTNDKNLQIVIKNNKTGKSIVVKNLKQIKSASLDTGGYTGDWNDQSGRLALLHQKELVLNKSDTENMLQAVKAIRDISGLNNSISETIAKAIGNLVIKAINVGGGYATGSTTNTNSVFNITAEFPNANDVQTIKDAILSLPNIASQYIHQK